MVKNKDKGLKAQRIKWEEHSEATAIKKKKDTERKIIKAKLKGMSEGDIVAQEGISIEKVKEILPLT